VATTYTQALRLAQPAIGDPTTYNVWGGLLNTDMALIEAAITGLLTLDLSTVGGAVTLTSNNGAADQARNFAIVFINATEQVTVTLPPTPKVYALGNAGGYPIILTAGGGTNYTLNPDGLWHSILVNASNNVGSLLPNKLSQQMAFYGSNAAGTFTVTTPTIKVYMWGAGGNGGAGAGAAGSGGGGGGYLEFVLALPYGTVVTYSVGATGAQNATTLTAAGGISATAQGGMPGGAGNSSTYGYALQGVGGGVTVAGIGSYISYAGETSATGFAQTSGSTIVLASATRGGSTYGGGQGGCGIVLGNNTTTGVANGGNGTGPGGGGGGGFGAGTGGLGAGGLIKVEYLTQG
jgi:hypothetical protein